MKNRLFSVDILRAVAILLMIEVHFVQNLSPREIGTAQLYDWAEALGSLPAPIFTFLVGLSLWLWLNKNKDTDQEKLIIPAVKRGIFIFVFGLAFAVSIWLPNEIFNWDILPFIGIATLLVLVMRKWPDWSFIVISMAVLAVSPLLREMTNYAAHWDHWGEYIYQFTIKDVLLGMLLHGYFPMLPWIVFPLMGYVTGRNYLNDARPAQSKWTLPAVGLGLIIASILFAGVWGDWRLSIDSYLYDMSFYPANTPFVLGVLGLILLSLWGLHEWLDNGESNPLLLFFQRYSRFSLTTYWVHHMVHVWPLYLAAFLKGRNDLFWFYADAISTPNALWLTLVFVILYYGVLVVWDRSQGKYSFEWVLRKLSS